MDIRPIRSEEDYTAALREIEGLMDADPGTADEDRLDVLVTLVEAYEARHHPIPPPDPIEAIRYYMESRGVTKTELARCIGTRGRISEVLNRRRPLTLEMIRRLHVNLGVPPSILIQPYQTVPAARKVRSKRLPESMSQVQG